MILTSQAPVTHWHEQIGDRLVHNAYRIELSGESICKNKNPKPEGGQSRRLQPN
jgi:DNA replication protein DnaC